MTIRVYVAGQMVGATELSASGALCRWRISASSPWEVIAGSTAGTSQSDMPAEDSSMYVFAHPIDVCFEADISDPTDHEWPHIELELRAIDSDGRADLGGYATVHVPTNPGSHKLACRVWRPRGSRMDRIAAWFVGGRPQLKDDSLVYGMTDVVDDGAGGPTISRHARTVGQQRLTSEPGALVHLHLEVMTQVVKAVVAAPAP